ncbi:unnamed protein product, partial [Urochloa humidicola]
SRTIPLAASPAVSIRPHSGALDSSTRARTPPHPGPGTLESSRSVGRAGARAPIPLPAMAEKLAPEKRHAFVHNGQKVFEWDQTLEEVNMYIELPKGVPTKLFRCTIQAGHVEVGIRGNPPYLNHDLTHPVKTDSSFWTIEDGEMHITLQKREKGKTWSSPIQGQGILDPYAADQEQKRLMLQRFQEENPGFDFSQAQFSGTCPDPRTFMGGMRSD